MADEYKPIQFRNLVDRENRAREGLEELQAKYERMKKAPKGLNPAEKADLARIAWLLDTSAYPDTARYLDPLFTGVRTLFRSAGLGGVNRVRHWSGVLYFPKQNGQMTWPDREVGQRSALAQLLPPENDGGLLDATVLVALVLGFIELDRVPLPRLLVQETDGPEGRKRSRFIPDPNDPNYDGFYNAFYGANAVAGSHLPLASRVLEILATEGDADKGDAFRGVVDTVEFARVMRGLIAKRVGTSHAQLSRAVNRELNKIQAAGDDVPLHEINVQVRDFDREMGGTNNCKPDNIRCMGVMISTFMLDQLRLWEVMDVVQRDFRQGTLLVKRSTPATRIFQWWKDAPNRMSDFERRETLALTLGFPGGTPETRKNNDFDRLWTQFIVSFTSLVRQGTVDSLLRTAVPAAIGQQRLRKAARDLAVNLSLYGYGMAYYSAVEFNKQADSIIEILNADEVRANYGGADDWSQVVDEIATLQLGGARNSSRYRTLATCGGIITAWLAEKVEDINSATGQLVDLNDLLSGAPSSSPEPTRTPTDYDCWNACEMWMSDQQISTTDGEVLAQKSLPSPQASSRPIQVPEFARDALQQAGVSLSVRPTNGYGNGYARY